MYGGRSLRQRRIVVILHTRKVGEIFDSRVDGLHKVAADVVRSVVEVEAPLRLRPLHDTHLHVCVET